MFFALITLLSALSIAAVAAWFSIAGLMAIFAASALPVAIMAGALEVGKLVTASWLYRNWKTAPFTLKSYLTVSVLVLMFITSLGIFGYLSKAHIEQGAPIGDRAAQIERIEIQINRHQRSVNDAEALIAQLDQTVNTLIEFDKISGPDGSRAVRERQEPQRLELRSVIDNAENEISVLLDEKFSLEQQVRQFETEIGPIKYIAELIYESPNEKIDSAVRVVILLLIFVFDPLAVLLLIAANHTLLARKQKLLENDNSDIDFIDEEPESEDIDEELDDEDPEDEPEEITEEEVSKFLELFDVEEQQKEAVQEDIAEEIESPSEDPVIEEPEDLDGVRSSKPIMKVVDENPELVKRTLRELNILSQKRDDSNPLTAEQLRLRSVLRNLIDNGDDRSKVTFNGDNQN